MASKFKRNGIYYIRYKDPSGKWKNYSCGPDASAGDAEAIRSKYAAQEFNSRHKTHIKAIQADLVESMRLFQSDILLRSDTGRDKAKNTLRRERVVIDNFLNWADPSALSYQKLTTEVIRKYFDHLQSAGKAAKTRKEERRILTKFFDWSIKQHYCEMNPVDIPRPKLPDIRPEFFSMEDLELIFSKANQPFVNIFKFLYLTGIRVGELCNLEIRDYLQHNKMIMIRVMEGNKTKREESVPLNQSAIDVLNITMEFNRRFETEESKIYMFVNNAGQKLDNENVLRALKRINKKWKTHTFRHTCASHLVIKGVSLYVVKEILRHRSIKETEVYSHLTKDVVRNAIDLLSTPPAPNL